MQGELFVRDNLTGHPVAEDGLMPVLERTLLRLSCVLAVALVAGCGSTAQMTTSRLSDGLSGQAGETSSLPGAGPAPALRAAGSAVTAAPGAPGTDPSQGRGTAAAARGPAGSNAVGAAPSAPLAAAASTGLGVTATTISIGIGYSTNGDTANSAIGASGISSGDTLANAKALVEEVNAAGGVAGRKVVAVYFAYDATSTQPGATQDQAACSAFTQDHQVIAVLSSNLSDVLPACLKKAGVVFLKSGVIVAEDATYLRQYSNEFLLGTMAQDRLLTDQVTSFVRQEYFGGWNTVTGQAGPAPTKLAVLTYDPASFTRAVNGSLLPALAAAGHPVAASEVYPVHKPATQSDVSGLVTQIKTATLQMQQDGVTHLVFNDASGLLLGLFSSNASSQQYFPRFGVTSGAGVQAIYAAGLVKANQLNGMSGNGWMPSLDLPAADTVPYQTSATKRCLEIMKRRTGQTYTSTNAASLALGQCDQVFAFTQAMAKAPSLSPAGLIAGLESLGSSFVSAILPAAFLSAAQHDDGVRAFDLNWVAGCTCVRYTSPRNVP